MSSTDATRYAAVPDEENFAHLKSEGSEENSEDRPFISADTYVRHTQRSTSRTVSRILAVANLVLFLVLLVIWLSVLKTSNRYCPEGPDPPYSKVREDGAVRFVNQKFRPHLVFQSEPSVEVDAAWNDTMQYDNAVGLRKELVHEHGLPRSIEDPKNSDVQIYGVSVFHQLHCLDIIRRSLYPDRYFPSHTHEQVLSHYNHCFDFLRQAIMCAGDVTMIYWWNTNYTTILEDGTTRDSDYYLSLNPKQRVQQSFVKWDVEHQCHDLGRVVEWLDTNEIDRPW